MKTGFDIHKINGEGYLIIPLSMDRLSSGQDPKSCYKILDDFINKLETYSNDVIFLYTNGLYFNTVELSFEKRKKTNQQMINHSMALRRLIKKRRKYIPNAFHFLPIDYIILNSEYFAELFAKLKKLEREDKIFRNLLIKDSKNREYNEANINFLLEEIVVAHIIRQGMVEFPRTLVKNDTWRLIAYPGIYLYSDVYQWNKNILIKKETTNPYKGAQYDTTQKKIFIFDNIKP